MIGIARSATWLVAGVLAFVPTTKCSSAADNHVLMIGIDGVRPDALAVAKTPHLDKLNAGGAFADNALILSERYQKNDTVSGPGWSSLLTGVWADKHGVQDNSFQGHDYESYPHFFARLKSQFPFARTGSFITWMPIDEYIVSHADVQRAFPPGDPPDYSAITEQAVEAAIEFLAHDAADATMIYFGQVDESGHSHGFHPSVKQYLAAIEEVDTHIGTLIDTIEARPNFKKENWLIVASSDHGGRGTAHGGGHDAPEILHTFFLVSGPAAKRGKLEEQTYIVDLPVTALTHLGVKIDPKWKLDGKSVGLKQR